MRKKERKTDRRSWRVLCDTDRRRAVECPNAELRRRIRFAGVQVAGAKRRVVTTWTSTAGGLERIYCVEYQSLSERKSPPDERAVPGGIVTAEQQSIAMESGFRAMMNCGRSDQDSGSH
jgi:hypothetical protein